MFSLISLKAKLWAIAGGVLAFLALILRNRSLVYQRDKAKHRAKLAEAGIKRQAETGKREDQIDADTDSRTREMADKIEADEPLDSLKDPNKW